MIFSFLTKKVLIITVASLVGIGALIGIIVYFTLDRGEEAPKGAIVTNGPECSKIGGDIISKGGNAVDATIASLLCEGVSLPQSTGLGGGFLMTIYHNGSTFFLNSRETAPAKATEDMMGGDPEVAARGGLSVAVPAELKGYWTLYKRFGSLPWETLVQPTIDLCLNGITVTPYSEGVFKQKKDLIYKVPELREIFLDKNNNSLTSGMIYTMPRLAETLKLIAKEGGDVLHNGSLTKNFVQDIADHGGIITEEDLNNYEPQWLEPMKSHLPNGYTIYSAPLPGSGVILTFILNILNGFIDNSPEKIVTWQRITESFKFGYGKRSELGDRDDPEMQELIRNLTSIEYANEIRKLIKDDITYQDPTYYGAQFDLIEDHGTAHISVLHPNGDAVSVTSTINLWFGAGFVSPSTGIILNDQMDDFAAPNITNSFGVPASPHNYIRPGKRPISSMCPTLVIDKEGKVKMVIGGAGGTRITTGVIIAILQQLLFKMDLKDNIDAPRIHHQLFPMNLEYENGFDMGIIEGLANIGHNVSLVTEDGFSALTGIARAEDGTVKGSYDRRRGGSVTYI